MVRDSQAGRYIWDGVAAFDDLLDSLFFEFRRKPLGAHDIPSYAQRIGGACLPDQGQSSTASVTLGNSRQRPLQTCSVRTSPVNVMHSLVSFAY